MNEPTCKLITIFETEMLIIYRLIALFFYSAMLFIPFLTTKKGKFMRFVLIALAILLNNTALAASGCMLEMNGRWALDAEKSLDPDQLKYEVLIFKNTNNEQSYSMEFENSATDKGSLEWSAPCDGKDYASPKFPWSTAPESTVAITRLGDKLSLIHI